MSKATALNKGAWTPKFLVSQLLDHIDTVKHIAITYETTEGVFLTQSSKVDTATLIMLARVLDYRVTKILEYSES